MEEKLLSKRFENDGYVEGKYVPVDMTVENAIYNFEKECDEGVYTFETYKCECGASEEHFEVLAKKDRYGLEVNTVICKCCGMIMTNPRINQDGYNLFYDKYYRDIYSGSHAGNEAFFNKQLSYGRQIVKSIEAFIDLNRIKSVLEIGCGSGGILKAFDELGKNYTIKGVDLGSEYVLYGSEKGLDLENISSSELAKRNCKYSLIILCHVFEHFLDIEKELKAITELLEDDGYLYIEVPGAKNIVRGGAYNGNIMLYLQNAHVRHFTKTSLTNIMGKYGFELIVGNEQVASLFRKGKKIEAFHSEYDEQLKFWNDLEKRHLLVESEEIKALQQEELSYKIEQEYLDKWVENLEKGKLTSKYLLSKGYKSVAIYGDGNVGQQLYMELLKTGFTVDYIVKTENNEDIEYGVPMFGEEENLPPTQLMIMTLPLKSTTIRRKLSEYNFDIMPFGSMILEQYE